MRCSGWSSLAISACSALVLASTAPAHVEAVPAFLASGGSASIELVGPNERTDPMTSFVLVAPDGFAIEHAHEIEGWSESLDGSTATWTDGSLAPDAEATFGVTLKANIEPGVVQLEARQRYEDGAVVSWPVAITVTPADENGSENLPLADVVALIGVLAVVAIGMLAWRRREAARHNA